MAALRRLDVLYSEPEFAFQRIVEMVAEITGAPSAIISFVDSERQWLKARRNCDTVDIPRNLSVCSEAIRAPDDVCVIPDARLDRRFRSLPAVTQPNGLRFYAGAAIVTRDGYKIGMLAVLGQDARWFFPETHRRLLRQFADIVMDELELRSVRRNLVNEVGKLERAAEESARRERELVAARLEADAARREKQRFLAHMTHELRTPLHGIRGMTALLAESDLTPEQRTFARVIDERAEALLGLIGDVLDSSKLDAGRVTLARRPFSPADVLLNALTLVSTAARQKSLSLRVDLGAELPGRVQGDELRVQQVLVNLLGNAVKFTARGAVGVRACHGGGRLRFEVWDTGPGIPPEEIAAIFEPFRQIEDAGSARPAGSGLGLAISRELVQLMQGGIFARNNPSGGTTFGFEIPADEAAAAEEAAPRLLAGVPVLLIGAESPALARASSTLGGAGAAVTTLPGLGGAAAAARSVLHEGGAVLVAVRSPADLEKALRGIDVAGLARQAAVMLCWENVPPSDDTRFSSRACPWPLWHPNLASAVAGRLAPQDGQAQAISQPLSGLDVLVAEDDATSADIARKTLERAGARVVHAPTGRLAVEAANRAGFDVLLLDVNLPGLSGPEALRAIRRGRGASRAAPAVALTASATSETRDGIMAAGFARFLFKPYAPAALRALLAELAGVREPPPPAAVPGRALIDVPYVCSLRQLLGEAEFRASVERWSADFGSQLLALGEALARGEPPHACLHKMKGTAGACGARALARLLQRAEAAAAPDMASLQRCFEQSRKALSRLARGGDACAPISRRTPPGPP